MSLRLLRALAALLFFATPLLAHAWWNADWSYRKKLTLDAAQVGIKEGLASFAVPVRLHTGNFLFSDAREDGADIRFIAGDDKTPLKFYVELFDPVNELAILWVQVPKLAGSETVWMYYGNAKAQAGADARGTYDVTTTAALNFSERDGAPKDATAYANSPTQSTAVLGGGSAIGNGARLDGNQRIVIPASPSLKLAPANGFTFSAWVKADGAQSNAVLFAQTDGTRGVQGTIDGNRLTVTVSGIAKPAQVAVDLTPGAWQHVAVALSNRLAVYLNGEEAGAAEAAVPDLGGDVTIGAGFRGEIDAVQLANVARSADWAKAQFASQAAEGTLVRYGEDEQAGGGGHSYFGILIDNLTVDAWVVIIILMIMLLWSFVIMGTKAVFLSRTEKANQDFVEEFEKLAGDLTKLDPDAHAMGAAGTAAGAPNGHPAKGYQSLFWRSPIYRLYHSGVREVLRRFDLASAQGASQRLSPQAIEAIRAVLDARIVRENQRLNSQMVLLTIAISGGPFLGLLGTVVGVMIVFAAVAAAGDVNVTAIAPGIAAALLATVAGLAVAIPALFGYNWLASRIKNIQGDMQVFADELLTKFAEAYSH